MHFNLCDYIGSYICTVDKAHEPWNFIVDLAIPCFSLQIFLASEVI